MTGRAAGYCAGYDEPGFTDNVGYGRGLGLGRGFRGGFRGRGFAPTYGYGRGGAWGRGRGFFRGVWPAAPAWTEVDEKQALAEQARGLEAALESIKERLAKLEDTEE